MVRFTPRVSLLHGGKTSQLPTVAYSVLNHPAAPTLSRTTSPLPEFISERPAFIPLPSTLWRRHVACSSPLTADVVSNGFVGGPAGISYYFQKGAPSWVDASLLTSGTLPGDGEWIVGQGRVSGTFLQPQLLYEFPFDTQVGKRGGARRACSTLPPGGC